MASPSLGVSLASLASPRATPKSAGADNNKENAANGTTDGLSSGSVRPDALCAGPRRGVGLLTCARVAPRRPCL